VKVLDGTFLIDYHPETKRLLDVEAYR